MKKNKLAITTITMFFVMAVILLGGGTTAEAAKKGKYFFSGDLYYHTISDKQVEVCGTKKSEGTLTIPSGVTYKGKKYIVTRIADNEFYYQDIPITEETVDGDCVDLNFPGWRYYQYAKRRPQFDVDELSMSHITKVVLPSTLTYIGEGAFGGCEELKEVVFAPRYNKLTIGKNAFCGMKLKELKFPSGTYELKQCAAGETPSIYIPSSVKKIAPGVVNADTKKVTISKRNKNFKMKDGILYSKDETKLISASGAVKKDVKISSKTKSIGKMAFAATKVQTVKLNKKITSIPKGAFASCKKLKSVSNTNNVTKIDYAAFFECYKLKNIGRMPKLSEIGRAAFWGDDQLNPITISSKMKIDIYAFSGTAYATKLKVNVAENDPVYSIVNGLLIKKDDEEQIVMMQTADAENLIVPEGVTRIAVRIGGGVAKMIQLPTTLKKQDGCFSLDSGSLIFTGMTVPEFGFDFDAGGVEIVYVPKGTAEAYRTAMDEAIDRRDGTFFFDDEDGPFIKEQ